MLRGSRSVVDVVYAPLSVALDTNKRVGVLNLMAHSSGFLFCLVVTINNNSNFYYFILWSWCLQLRFAVSGRKRREA